MHYPCLGLHNCRRRDCKRIVDKDEGLRTAKEQACLAERQPSEVDLGERESAVREEPVMTVVSSRLQLLPVQSCRSGVSRCRRPGLFWFGTSRWASEVLQASSAAREVVPFFIPGFYAGSKLPVGRRKAGPTL